MSIIIIAPKSKVINMSNRWEQHLKQKIDIRRVAIAILSILPTIQGFSLRHWTISVYAVCSCVLQEIIISFLSDIIVINIGTTPFAQYLNRDWETNNTESSNIMSLIYCEINIFFLTV